MKTFKEWYKEVNGVEPDYETAENKLLWCKEEGLPMIVSCTCCEGTMIVFNAFVDDEGYTYCPSCAGVE